MFIFKKFVSILGITFAFLVVHINPSHAIINIQEMKPADGSYYDAYIYNQYCYHTAYVETDVSISYVDWYVEGVLTHTSFVPANTNYASFSPFPTNITGTIKGKEHLIEAVVWAYDDQGIIHSDSDYYYVTLYEPIINSDANPKKLEGVSGYTELSRHYQIGNDVIMDYYVYVNYHGDEEVEYTVSTEYKSSIHGIADAPIDVPGNDTSGSIGYDKKDSDLKRSFDHSGSITNSALADGEPGVEYDCYPYVRLTVHAETQRDWHDENLYHSFSPVE